jgi:hypothetical protein
MLSSFQTQSVAIFVDTTEQAVAQGHEAIARK